MKINKAFNPKTRGLTNNFPKWSAAYADPNSNANKLLNPFANIFEYFENLLQDIHDDAVISRVDVDRHPYKRWAIDYRDVISFPDTYETAENFLLSVTSFTGTIGGQTIPLVQVPNNSEFYNPLIETGWYIGASIPHNLSGTIGACTNINGSFYIYVKEDEENDIGDPGEIYELNLPTRWNPRIQDNTELTLIGSEPDPSYGTINKEVTTTDNNTRILLDHQLSDRLDKIIVIDNLASTSEETVFASGVSLTDTSEYEVRDVYVADIDDDEIIDQVEIDEITSQLGKSRIDYTDDEWKKYSKYDINGDNKIDQNDLNVALALVNSVQRDATAITIPSPGSYTIQYEVPVDGYAATTALYDINGNLEIFTNETYNYLQTQWTSGYIDVTYDNDKGLYYYLDDATKSFWAYEQNVLGTTFDRVKFQLPILTNMRLVGIQYYSYRIYILAFSGDLPYIITVKTDVDDIANNIVIVPIHSGAKEDEDGHIITRDNTGLNNTAVGLTIINGAKLATIDGDDIKILLPIYDYFTRSIVNDRRLISFREKYESFDADIESVLSPVYMDLWNIIDFHGEEKGLPRIPGESNESFKNRILDVYVHFPSRDNQGSRYGMQREIGLDIVDSYKETILNLLPTDVDRTNAASVTIYDDDVEVQYDTIDIENQYRYGKYTHDKITYKQSGTEILSIDKDIVE